MNRSVRLKPDITFEIMRDMLAGVIALALLLVAGSLATSLQRYRRRRQRTRAAERALGRTVIAEIPTDTDLALFSEDEKRFYYGDQSIDKDLVAAVRILINGAPIAAVSRHAGHDRREPPSGAIDDPPDGIARDRWDVAIETVAGTIVVACGAIRERVSQELARSVFDAVKRTIEAGGATTPFRPRPPDGS